MGRRGGRLRAAGRDADAFGGGRRDITEVDVGDVVGIGRDEWRVGLERDLRSVGGDRRPTAGIVVRAAVESECSSGAEAGDVEAVPSIVNGPARGLE